MRRDASNGKRSRVRPVVLVLLVFAVLAAVLLLLRPPFEPLLPESDAVHRVAVVNPATSDPETATEAPSQSAPVDASSRSGVKYRTLSTARIALLPARVESKDAQARAILESIRQALLARLGSAPEIGEIVDISAQQLAGFLPVAGSTVPEDMLEYLAVTRRLGDVLVIEVAESSPADASTWLFGVRFNGPHTRVDLGSASIDHVVSPDVDPEVIAAQFAESILDMTAQSLLETAVSAERVSLADARTDRERINALRSLGSAGFKDDVLSMAVSLGAGAQDAADRRSAWLLLRDRVYDPMLSDALSYALLSDADPSVREAAAEALGIYIGVPAARAALEYAADNDASTEVRLTSRLASMNRADVADFVHATLLDRSLAPEERIAPMVQSFSRDLDGGRRQLYGPAYTEKAQALIEIVMASEDYAVKTQGFDQLQQVVEQSYASGDMGPELVDLLTESRLVDDMQTRTRMLRLLSNLSSVPEVRSRLDEIAEQNPELVETMPFYFMDQNTSDLVPGLGRASL